MAYSNRGINGVPGPSAESDVTFAQYVYNGTSGLLSIGMPVYVDVTDPAEEVTDPTTGLTAGNFLKNTGGGVVLGTSANAGANLMCVGIFQPSSRNVLPNSGDVIRVLAIGRGIVSAQSPAGGAAGTVGGNLIASAAVAQAVPGTRASGINIGILLASRAVVTPGASLFTAASATVSLYNAFVNLS